jgi:hypothetical protein
VWWRLSDAEPGLGGSLDRGGLGDPSGDERRVASGVEGCPEAVDLVVGVGDGLAGLLDLAGGIVGGERRAILGVGDASEVVGQSGSGQFFAEESVDGAGDRVLAQVERRRVADLVLADKVTAGGAAVVEASVVRVADHLAVAQAAGDQAAEQVGRPVCRGALPPSPSVPLALIVR